MIDIMKGKCIIRFLVKRRFLGMFIFIKIIEVIFLVRKKGIGGLKCML